MARAATAAAPRLLRTAMLLLLLVAAGRRAAGAPVVNELRCHCLQTLQGIHLKNIQSVKMTPPGPHCGQTEVIATLKNGQEACLNPEAPMVKKIINKMLNKSASRITPKPSETYLSIIQQRTLKLRVKNILHNYDVFNQLLEVSF
ncbi:hypothetical protein E5288_WYG019214 [Bos mutus]|uniref:C-X-C motif chemokine n=1 Tax=Bos mutus TaxID=72004 RepID=A0A6B0S0K8_9CETA|nr:hypothetical protein [Bos mutus]